MKRRNFLRDSALVSLPLMLGGFKLKAASRPFGLFSQMDENSDRVLVLIQLNGGNDGLNTFIPLDQYDTLANLRSNILIPENQMISLTDEVGLHPAMEGVRNLYDDGKFTVIQSVGYTNQNRSHFRSLDIWNTGSGAEEVITTGWLGRHFDEDTPTYPDDFPNDDYPDPFAIVLGNAVSETCQGLGGNYSIALADPFNLGQLPVFGGGVDLNTPYGMELSWLREVIGQTNAYAGTVSTAAEMGNSTIEYPESELAAKLQNVARLISGGLQTKIYIVELGGFDTHANQTTAATTTQGIHADLLQTLSDAIYAFQQDLAALGIEERVVGMTYSEFGRRIRSNSGFGTDHGDAAPLMLFGSCVAPGFIGANPEISPEATVDEGVALQYEFRNVYGSVLVDWFGVSAARVQSLIYEDFNYFPVLNGCNTTSTNDPILINDTLALEVFPNPFKEQCQLRFQSGNERVRIVVFNNRGQEVRLISERQLTAGEQRINLSLSGLAAGVYYVQLRLGNGRRVTKRIVKM
ncbi:MAG: DUF1501 domain-containing protein [Bacteroidota bacterium]